MRVTHTELAQVGHLILDSRERAGEPLGICRVTEHARSLEPVRAERANLIEPVQLGVAFGVGIGGQREQSLLEHRHDVGRVDGAQTRVQIRPPPLHA